MEKYKRMSYEVRCQINALLDTKNSVSFIAKYLGFNKSTIYRELKRNSYWNTYRPAFANQQAKRRFKSCRRKVKIQGRIEKLVQSGLKEGWSPEQVAGRLRHEKITNLSHETVYRYTKVNPEFRQYLRWFGRRGYGRYRQKLERPSWMVSITQILH